MRGQVLTACIALLALPMACVDPAPAPSQQTSDSNCHVSYVVDGDTVHLTCNGQTHKTRLTGYDTPEVFSPQCGAEKQAGDAATRTLQGLVASGPVTGAAFQGVDRYGRDLVRLEIGGQEVAKVMISSGLARAYGGREHPDWCAIFG